MRGTTFDDYLKVAKAYNEENDMQNTEMPEGNPEKEKDEYFTKSVDFFVRSIKREGMGTNVVDITTELMNFIKAVVNSENITINPKTLAMKITTEFKKSEIRDSLVNTEEV
jgi:hypothetical protein